MPERPALHFTPERNWMNDPNGLIWHDGIYHLFFQHNPHGNTHGNMSWGHATSIDLVTWQHHPIALMHDDSEDVFSGSIVWDEHNTSGLAADGESPLVAVYTSARRTGDSQAQSVAFSLDGGYTWSPYRGNPVLDLGTDDFRDPKVLRYTDGDDSYWVMVAVEARSRRVVFFRSEDLLRWTYLSSYGPAGSVEGFWECPDMFPLFVEDEPGEKKWVLIISVASGSPAGGSGTKYVIGDFDGTTFIASHPLPPVEDGAELERPLWLDRGRDCYAGVTFSGLAEEHRVLIAWMSNWDYAQDFPTSPWRGSMTTARQLTLQRSARGTLIAQRPIIPAGREIVAVEQEAWSAEPVTIADSLPTPAFVQLRAECAARGSIQVQLHGADDSTFTISYEAATTRLQIDRTDSGDFHPSFPSRQAVALPDSDGTLVLCMVLDTTSIELFAGHHETAITNQVLMEHPWRLTVSATGHGSKPVLTVTVRDLTPVMNGHP